MVKRIKLNKGEKMIDEIYDFVDNLSGAAKGV